MNFHPREVYRYGPLLRGNLTKRLNRFVSVVELDHEDGSRCEEECYMANPGSMLGMCIQGAEVRVSRATNLNRKLKFSVESVLIEETWIGCNTHIANAIVGQILRDNILSKDVGITEFCSFKAEVRHGDSRFDFMLAGKESNKKTFIEVKTVTMASNWYDIETKNARADKPIKDFPEEAPPECESGNIALFPDCKSVRALKHVQGLADLVTESTDSILIFAIMRDDISAVAASSFCDKDYAAGLQLACSKGVKAIGLKMRLDVSDLNDSSISLTGIVPLVFDDTPIPASSLANRQSRKRTKK